MERSYFNCVRTVGGITIACFLPGWCGRKEMTIITGSKGFSQNDYRSQREHLLKIQHKPFTGCLFYKGNLSLSGDLVKDIKQAGRARWIQGSVLYKHKAWKKKKPLFVSPPLSPLGVNKGRPFSGDRIKWDVACPAQSMTPGWQKHSDVALLSLGTRKHLCSLSWCLYLILFLSLSHPEDIISPRKHHLAS